MKYRYVFILGRAGCGKSALYRELERLTLESNQTTTSDRVDDFPIFWAKFLRDDALEEEGKARIYSRPTDDGDYIVTNDRIWRDALRELNTEVLADNRPNHMTFIEFARSSYVDAIQCFDRSILDNCLVVFIEVSFDTCWVRNLARHRLAIADGGDDHLVSREEMERSFLHDDQDALIQFLEDRNIPVVVVNNEADGEEHLREQVAELLRMLF
jgi:hypothetical protein